MQLSICSRLLPSWAKLVRLSLSIGALHTRGDGPESSVSVSAGALYVGGLAPVGVETIPASLVETACLKLWRLVPFPAPLTLMSL